MVDKWYQVCIVGGCMCVLYIISLLPQKGDDVEQSDAAVLGAYASACEDEAHALSLDAFEMEDEAWFLMQATRERARMRIPEPDAAVEALLTAAVEEGRNNLLQAAFVKRQKSARIRGEADDIHVYIAKANDVRERGEAWLSYVRGTSTKKRGRSE